MSQTWHKVLPHFRDLEIIINRQGCGAHTLCTYICTYILHIYIFVPHAFVHLLCKPCECI